MPSAATDATSSHEYLAAADQDWSDISDRYADRGRVLATGFLSAGWAAQLLGVCKMKLPWVLHCRADGRTISIPEPDLAAPGSIARRAFDSKIVDAARKDFQFSYFGCSLAPNDLRGFEPGHAIHGAAAKIVSYEFASTLAALTRDRSIKGLTASLTRYDTGHFLLPHDDTDAKDDRRAAFVLNLSEDWWPDWGGLLQFIDGDRNVTETFSPHFGSLALFKVPQMHAVSLVAPYALRPRFAITGWLIA